jgi:toxin ParE1/3/4
MNEFRLSPEAETELDGIWIHIARESGSPDIATRVVESIAERFWLLARYPYIGRRRDEDLRAGLRSLAAGDYVIIHRITEDNVVLILRVVHGSRDLIAEFGPYRPPEI